MFFIQNIFKSVPCFQCASYNRALNTLNRIYKTPLRASKCLNKKYISNKSIFELNTNVTKDVLLFKSSSDRTYKIISIFAVVQFGFWLTVADSYYALLNKNVNDSNENHTVWWMDKLKTKGKIVTVGIPVGCICMGAILVAICAVYTMKSVKMLVLCKGGENLNITSFGPFNKNIVTTIPLDKISCSVGRNTSNQTIPLKVKGKWFFYTLDKNGTIYNPQLFDITAGLKRKI
ncbi:transmembrane protein 223 [Adelges cooleyi]|uniref:transmembrane protein 223 n=1 Tax=Adelges cooleyi TaxID=133065 RepID=UPI00217FC57A|nr:transmembrane protein 223 [Adelges cooleyi]XP_050434912.1 transmembrane protein 223 [Adelges cooleyi]